ncbi:hypothetical protein DUI87_08606 [Hirundo rustica rustica]|uniref:Uncharacterized protein n=1 Tax=Hirundo rustica rustica TaxID=333673 RepID=A0A3M0KS22_HIRRU|nr:hypothetical protein DUI87_08606 [Hirundo rustica rustica]
MQTAAAASADSPGQPRPDAVPGDSERKPRPGSQEKPSGSTACHCCVPRRQPRHRKSGAAGLSQAVVPVSSSGGGGSFPCQKQSLKGRHAEGAAEPHTSKSLVAKCRRAEDVPDLGTETGTPSTASRGLPGLSPGVVLVGRAAAAAVAAAAVASLAKGRA